MRATGLIATRFFYTALAAALFAFGVIVVDAYTRLSAEPADCAAIYDCAQPQRLATSDAETRNGWRPVLLVGATWQQRVHPFLAGALALIIVRLGYLGWHIGGRSLFIPIIVFALLSTLVLPDVLGADLRIQPWTQLLQVAGALAIVTLLWWLALREQRLWRASAVDSGPTRALRIRALVAGALLVLSSALGTWSTVSHGGLPCVDFPTCQGSWWPAMDLTQAFAPSQLTQVNQAKPPLPIATATHMIHRLSALIALLYVGWLATRVLWAGDGTNLCRYGLVILVLLMLEISLGIMAVVNQLPIGLLLAHSVVGVLLLLSMVTLYHATRPRLG
ncbi:MAG: COX15/CtaA family protein [Acidiferrobacterales bacterium]|nr:COX15/CtaA family protein [Acidiferrobacterales bacterium]